MRCQVAWNLLPVRVVGLLCCAIPFFVQTDVHIEAAPRHQFCRHQWPLNISLEPLGCGLKSRSEHGIVDALWNPYSPAEESSRVANLWTGTRISTLLWSRVPIFHAVAASKLNFHWQETWRNNTRWRVDLKSLVGSWRSPWDVVMELSVRPFI
jgi:hypothetical protein